MFVFSHYNFVDPEVSPDSINLIEMIKCLFPQQSQLPPNLKCMESMDRRITDHGLTRKWAGVPLRYYHTNIGPMIHNGKVALRTLHVMLPTCESGLELSRKPGIAQVLIALTH